jgi:ElaA protein
MNKLRWDTKHFNDLTPFGLYAVMRLRNEVFVVEQNCVFQDADNKDQSCFHLLGYIGNDLAAYARLVPAGITYEGKISIGRVITSPAYRQMGAGKALMIEAIENCYRLFGKQPIKMGAQLYLKNFYESFGFIQTSEVYDEDGIPHIEMIKD